MDSPLLDVAIGLVFIFLLYSLLVTSIHEAIATLLSTRAKMLRRGIIESMLSDTRHTYIPDFIKNIADKIQGVKDEKKNKIGEKFYEHPLIKNYGSGAIYQLPSYIPANNFSKVLINILKKVFDENISLIAAYKAKNSPAGKTAEQIKEELQYNSDITKIKELLDYYNTPEGKILEAYIEKDTFRILKMHLEDSIYNLEKFEEKLEVWYDDTMNRVSGWYKRQTQGVLFIIGICIAITFNVDTIEISKKLSSNKDARDKLVQVAIEASEKYKDDPRVIRTIDEKGNSIPAQDTNMVKANYKIFESYKTKTDSIQAFIKNDIEKSNDILSLGWGDYGKKKMSERISSVYFNTDLSKMEEKKRHLLEGIVAAFCDKHFIRYKIVYVFEQIGLKKLLGFLITAFAISLGAPFWFDLLNKLVKIRSAGKKEETSGSGSKSAPAAAQQVVNVNANTQAGEEAVG